MCIRDSVRTDQSIQTGESYIQGDIYLGKRSMMTIMDIEIELQHHPVRNLSEEKREIAAYVSKALSFVRKMQKS